MIIEAMASRPVVAPFTVLIKPAGADCNLHCGYCFYLAAAGLYPETVRPRMSLTTVEQLLTAYFAIPMRQYSFAWQGGEPTLMGTDFFREVFAMQRRLAPAGTQVTNAIQTNGTLLTEEWATLLRENRVLVGVSIDGPAEVHNRYRRWADRHGAAISGEKGDTHARVEGAIRLLRETKVEYNALTVVGRHNMDHPVDVYDYLRSLRIRHMQFIPLVEWNGTEASEFSVTAEGWGQFLIKIFDRWFPKDVRRVSIRHHDSVMAYLVGGEHNVCTMSDSCGGHVVVEHNGDLYPCDFYVRPDLRLGSLSDPGNPLEAAVTGEQYREFRRQKARRPAECETCRYRRLCGGDCPKLREPASDGRGLSALCDGWKMYYDHTLSRFGRLSRAVAEEQFGPGRTPAVAVRKRTDSAVGLDEVELQ